MQIVINIDDRVYKNLMTENGWRGSELAKIIKNGTPLPKGHRGRGTKRTYEAEFFNGKCPYTDKPCYEWECDICEIEAQEKKDAEELDRAESEET